MHNILMHQEEMKPTFCLFLYSTLDICFETCFWHSRLAVVDIEFQIKSMPFYLRKATSRMFNIVFSNGD